MVEQNWPGLPPLWTETQYTSDSEYDPRGRDVDSFGIHHAVTPSLQAIIDLSKPGGRTVSMNLAVKDGRRVRVVPMDQRAYTSASSYDARSWTVEAANDTLAPDYHLSDATYESLSIIAAHAHVQEGIPLVHGVPGVYEHKNLYQWFVASYPTLCAGPHFDVGRVIRGALRLLTTEPETEEEEETEMKHVFVPGLNAGQGAIVDYAPLYVHKRPREGGEHDAWNTYNAYVLGKPATDAAPRNADLEVINEVHGPLLNVQAGMPLDWDLEAHPTWTPEIEAKLEWKGE